MLAAMRIARTSWSVLLLVALGLATGLCRAPDADAEEKIYWTDLGGFFHSLSRANLDGSNPQVIVPFDFGANTPGAVAVDVDHGLLFWGNRYLATNTNRQIRRATLEGSYPQTVYDPPSEIVGVEVDAVHFKVYWTESFSRIGRANLDGSGVETVLETGHALQYLALDIPHGTMYWSDFSTRQIMRATMDGQNVTPIINGSDPRGIAVDSDGGKLYWTDAGTLRVLRANLDGSGVEPLVTAGQQFPLGIDLDLSRGMMYWVDGYAHRIQRASLDGSGVTSVVTTGIDFPSDIALALIVVTDTRKTSWGRLKTLYR